MLLIVLTLLFLWNGSGMAGGAEVVLRDRTFSQVRDRVVLLAAEEFEPERLELIARRFLTNAGRHRLVQLYFVTSQGDANQYFSGKLVLEPSYSGWRRLYEAQLGKRGPMAWMLMLDGSAVLRIRDRHGRFHQRVLKRTDPTVLHMLGSQWEVLYVSVAEVAKALRAEDGDVHLTISIRTAAALTEQSCEAVARVLRDSTGVRTITVEFRNDSWFIMNPFFPVAYAFEPLKPAIAEDEYARTPEAYCLVREGRTACRARSPLPSNGGNRAH